MNAPRFVATTMAVLLAPFGIATTANAGIIRHDVSDKAYQAIVTPPDKQPSPNLASLYQIATSSVGRLQLISNAETLSL